MFTLQVLTEKDPVRDLFFGSEIYQRLINVTQSVPQNGWLDAKTTTAASTAAASSYLALIIFWQV